jgi:hypothetical protein
VTIRFEATSLTSALDEENDPFFYIFVTDETRSHYLTLQRAPAGSVDDDGRIYIEVDDQGFGGYDHISRCELSPADIRIELAKPLGARGEVSGLELSFARGVCTSPEFVEHLRAIFAGQEDRLVVCDGSSDA